MTIARMYRMQAAEGRGDELAQALAGLVSIVSHIAGCQGADLIRETDAPEQFLFIEKWDSIDAHEKGAASLPKGSFGAVGAALAAPPRGAYGQYL